MCFLTENWLYLRNGEGYSLTFVKYALGLFAVLLLYSSSIS